MGDEHGVRLLLYEWGGARCGGLRLRMRVVGSRQCDGTYVRINTWPVNISIRSWRLGVTKEAKEKGMR